MSNRMDSEEKARQERIEAKKAERREASKKFRKDPLKITSLMDALTIILIFLLKSYGSDPMEVPQKKNELMLPKSSSVSNMSECVDIQISRSAIVVKGKPVVKVLDGKTLESGATESSNPMLITKLKVQLDDWRKKAAEEKKKDVQKYEGEAFIAADGQIPFKIIKQVIFTAGMARYTRFTFAVVKTRGG